jgi:RNA polymerase sigma factor (TIGR02999 family)
MTSASLSLTEQLRRYSEGETEIAEAILREVLPKLHVIAVRELSRERFFAPLSPTELINEVWLSNLRKGGWQVKSRKHFYAIACLAMRRVLVDFARNRLAQRRGDGQIPKSLEQSGAMQWSQEPPPEIILQMGLLLDQLEIVNPDAARVVDMHYFAGFTLQEIAEINKLSFRQVRHRWDKAREWLRERIEEPRQPRPAKVTR